MQEHSFGAIHFPPFLQVGEQIGAGIGGEADGDIDGGTGGVGGIGGGNGADINGVKLITYPINNMTTTANLQYGFRN